MSIDYKIGACLVCEREKRRSISYHCGAKHPDSFTTLVATSYTLFSAVWPAPSSSSPSSTFAV